MRVVLQVDPVGGLPPHLENAIDHLGVLVQQQNGGHLGECFIPRLWLGWDGGDLPWAPDVLQTRDATPPFLMERLGMILLAVALKQNSHYHFGLSEKCKRGNSLDSLLGAC